MAEPKIINPNVVEDAADPAAETATAETAATTAETVTATTATATTAAPAHQRDYVAELTAKDGEIASLRAAAENAAATDAAREQLQLSLAQAITDRGQIATERDEAVKNRTAAIDTMSQAVQTADAQRQAADATAQQLREQIAEYERTVAAEKQAREQAEAIAVRSQVIVKEFPQLLPYLDRIVAANDEAKVRADAQALLQTRESDLDGLRRTGVAAALGLPIAAPTTPTTAPTGPDALKSELEKAIQAGDPVAFAKAKQAALDAYEASKPAAR